MPKQPNKDYSTIDQSKLIKAIDAMQPITKPLKVLVDEMSESIKRAVDRGVTWEALASMLKEKGVDISPLTLKKYTQGGGGHGRRHSRAGLEAIATTAAVAGTVEGNGVDAEK